jgi:hypothetical protein
MTHRLSEREQHADVEHGRLIVEYEYGPRREWKLPEKSNRSEIRRVLREAKEFGTENNATDGQLKAIQKALTDNGYYTSATDVERVKKRFEGLTDEQKQELIDELKSQDETD